MSLTTTAWSPDQLPEPTRGPDRSSRSALMRYLAVTLVASPAAFGLFVMFLQLGWRPVLANLASASLVSAPTYVVSRRWVWSLRHHVGPVSDAAKYWITTVINVVCSSVAVAVVGSTGASSSVLSITPIVVYTALWFVRFVYLDRVLFASARST